jgi:hypothetical protein
VDNDDAVRGKAVSSPDDRPPSHEPLFQALGLNELGIKRTHHD